MINSKLLLASSLLALAGCVTPYAVPPGAPTATLKIVNRMGTPAGSYLYEGTETCTNRKGLGKIEPWSEKLSQLAAEKRQVIMYGNATRVLSGTIPGAFFPCMLTLDFQPQTGKAYILSVEQNTTLGNCTYSFTEGGTPVEHKERMFITPWSEAGPFCPAE